MKRTGRSGRFVALLFGVAALRPAAPLRAEAADVPADIAHEEHRRLPGSLRLSTESFYEGFSSIDMRRWVRADWMARDTQFQRDAAFAHSDGSRLVLRHEVSGGGPPYKGGALYETSVRHYGSYRARLRAPDVPGLLCSFYAYAEDEARGAHEIDVELLTSHPTGVWFTAYRGWREGMAAAEIAAHKHSETYWGENFDIRSWHVYGFDWDAGRVDFFVDGRPVVGWSNVIPYKEARVTFSIATWACDPADDGCWNDIHGPPPADASFMVDWFQFEPGLTVTPNASVFRAGDLFNVRVSFQGFPLDWDAYLVITGRGRTWSVARGGLRQGLVPIAVNMMERSIPYAATVFSTRVPEGASGAYRLTGALVPHGATPGLEEVKTPYEQLAVSEFKIR